MLETVLDLKDLFNEKGYRYTEQREKILDILKQQSAKHLTAVDICVLAKKKYPKIGVATVYRTLSISMLDAVVSIILKSRQRTSPKPI